MDVSCHVNQVILKEPGMGDGVSLMPISKSIIDNSIPMNEHENESEHENEDNSSQGKSINQEINDELQMPKKKRRKPIKSCAFCRQRKLKCDQRKPICSTCFQRGRKECVYNDTPASVIVSDTDSTNEVLKHRILDLERRLCDAEVNKEVGAPTSKNELLELNFIEVKENGRRMMYGPTSTRTFFLSERWGLTKRYSLLWKKIKSERNRLKGDTGYSMLYENGLIDAPYDVLPGANQEITLLNELVRSLPSYETISRRLDSFFEDKELYIINEAFDRLKVMKDFKESFIPESTSFTRKERPIKKLIASSKKNYYKIGAILGILAYTEMSHRHPLPFEKFFVMLNGMSTGKANYIERVQVTFLRYCFRAKWGLVGGDAPHTIMLVNNMVNEALLLGLNTNINNTFEGHEILYGNLVSLRYLWLWILFCDFDSALQLGSLLKISDELIFDETIFHIDKDNEGSLYNLMGSLLKMSRPMLLSVYNKKRTPDLRAYCEDIIVFIEKKFPPISFYTDENIVEITPFHKMIVLSTSISLLLAFYGLRFLALNERTYHLRNALGTTTIIAFALSVNMIMRNYRIDKKKFPDTLRDPFENLSPYLCLTVSSLNRLIVRALSIFYSIFYHKLTLFENGLLMLNPNQTKATVDTTSFRVPSEEKLSLMSVFDNFSEIFDRLSSNSDQDFNAVVRRSHLLVTTFALERLCRKVLEKVLESRRVAEEAWMLQYQTDIDAAASNTAGPTSLGHSTNLVGDATSPRGNSTDIVPTWSPELNAGNMAGTMEDDFWSSYNVNWEEFLRSSDNLDFYYELMMKQ